jgi:hypothetical protein
MTEFDELESRLREFRPRRPAMIPDERLQRLRGPIWVGVAAGMAAAMVIAAWLHRSPRETVAPTLGALTTIGFERPDDLDGLLREMSRASLPDVTNPGGALRELSKEF